MDKRLKVLISAYACEPGKGSEPEVGWQWALQMARFHEVTVLTRENNRRSIEAELPKLSGPKPAFIYFDLPRVSLRMKKVLRMHRFYYVRWQRAAHNVIAQETRRTKYDLLHHVTFAAFRYPTAIWGHEVPCIWGPVGGVEAFPKNLLPWRYPGPLVEEGVRNLDICIQTAPMGALRRRGQRSDLVLASTRRMQETFAGLGVAAQLMPTIGLHAAELPAPARTLRAGPLRLLFVGNLLVWKGVDLALEALKQAGTDAQLVVIGDGPFRQRLQKQTARLGLGARVDFRGRIPRAEVLAAYREFDVCLFPSLHDTGGYAVIEAMCNAMPTICLAAGGPETALQSGGGICVPLGSRAEVVARLAEAIQTYDADRARLVQDGQAARRGVELNYDWEHKARRMIEFYQAATLSGKTNRPKS